MKNILVFHEPTVGKWMKGTEYTEMDLVARDSI